LIRVSEALEQASQYVVKQKYNGLEAGQILRVLLSEIGTQN